MSVILCLYSHVYVISEKKSFSVTVAIIKPTNHLCTVSVYQLGSCFSTLIKHS